MASPTKRISGGITPTSRTKWFDKLTISPYLTSRGSSRYPGLARGISIGCACALFLCGCATAGRQTKRAASTYSRYLKGLMSEWRGDFEGALRYYEGAKDLSRSAVAPYIHSGFNYIRLNKTAEAASEFEKALQVAPQEEAARHVLGMLYVQLRDFRRAAACYEGLLALHSGSRSQNIKLRHMLSQLYFLEEDYVSARRHAQAIIALDASDTEALYFIAILDSEEGRVAEAMRGFQQILLGYPDHADAMNALAYLWAEKEIELDKALGLAEKALEFDTKNPAYLDTLGWVYFKMGAIEKAVGLLERASQGTLDPVILNHLAEAYERAGRLKEAQERWTASLILDPRQEEARKRLRAVEEGIRARLKKNP